MRPELLPTVTYKVLRPKSRTRGIQRKRNAPLDLDLNRGSKNPILMNGFFGQIHQKATVNRVITGDHW